MLGNLVHTPNAATTLSHNYKQKGEFLKVYWLKRAEAISSEQDHWLPCFSYLQSISAEKMRIFQDMRGKGVSDV